MFCPNCGNKVSADDNYCKVCGKNLKNVKIIITKDADKPAETNKNFDQSTRVFAPIKNLNAIDNTHDLKNIINEVDKKISQNISEYKTNLNKPDENVQGPEKPYNKEIQDLSKIKGAKETVPTKSISKEVPSPDDKTDKTEVAPKKVKEKRSLKKIWRDFINEDDDEYSIFGNFDKESSDKKKTDVKIATTTSTPTTMENTMDIPLKDIEEALSSSKAEKTVEKPTAPKKDLKSAEVIEDLNTNIIFDENNRNFHMSHEEDKKYVEKKYSQSYNYREFTELVNSQLNEQKKDEPATEEKPDKLSLKEKLSNFKNPFAFKKSEEVDKNQETTQKIHEEKDVVEEVKSAETLTKSTKDKPAEKKSTLKTENKELKEEKASSDEGAKDSLANKVFSAVNGAYINLRSVLDSKLDISLFILGAVVTIAPIFIADRNITGALIFLCVAKLAFKILQYFLSLKVTTDKAWMETDEREVFSLSLFNFVLCELFLLVDFVFSPLQGVLKFTLMSALTPPPIAMILVCLLSVAIAVSLYWEFLRGERKLDFIAWYIITFLTVEFISKIFFIIAKLIITL
ncbi:MAG: hypothetical protein Q4D95_06595 [Peptoniphilus sp.]|nr:hypothetical protein [Peptoniphilus sp.]